MTAERQEEDDVNGELQQKVMMLVMMMTMVRRTFLMTDVIVPKSYTFLSVTHCLFIVSEVAVQNV